MKWKNILYLIYILPLLIPIIIWVMYNLLKDNWTDDQYLNIMGTAKYTIAGITTLVYIATIYYYLN